MGKPRLNAIEFKTIDALLSLEYLIKSLNDNRILHTFYLEFGRRLYTLGLVLRFCPQAPESWTWEHPRS
ncbi:MAG: hypothetical protein QXT64_07545 [Desulfurococcaceae archaeon]